MYGDMSSSGRPRPQGGNAWCIIHGAFHTALFGALHGTPYRDRVPAARSGGCLNTLAKHCRCRSSTRHSSPARCRRSRPSRRRLRRALHSTTRAVMVQGCTVLQGCTAPRLRLRLLASRLNSPAAACPRQPLPRATPAAGSESSRFMLLS